MINAANNNNIVYFVMAPSRATWHVPAEKQHLFDEKHVTPPGLILHISES